jgi:pimeloyl-ACP methyl ester carboxylesterase
MLAACGGGGERQASDATTTTTPTPVLTFYKPSTVLTGVKPGQILEQTAMSVDPSWAGTGARIKYVSTTPAGDHVPVTGVVLTPTKPPPPGGYPVVVFGHGTVGLGDPCAPSRQEPFQVPGAKEFLDAGYMVVAPDYEGLGIEGETHPYLVGEATGNNLLDGARVGKELGGGTKVVIFGVSQGGHATLFARQLAHDYLPGFDVLGVVAAGPVTNPATFLEPGWTNPDIFPFTAEAILAWSEVYHEPELTKLVVVKDAENVRLARDEWCTGHLSPPRPLDEIFLAQPEDAPTWQAAVKLNTPAAGDLGIPVMLTHGDIDPLVPISGTEKFHAELCAAGERVVFERDPTWGHAAAWLVPIDDIVAWVGQRFAGAPAPTDCPS